MITLNGYTVGSISKKDCIAYLTYWINLKSRRLLECGATSKAIIIAGRLEHLRFMLAHIKGEPTDDWVVKSPESFGNYIDDWMLAICHKGRLSGTQQGALFEKVVFLNAALGFTFPEIADFTFPEIAKSVFFAPAFN